MEHPTTADLVKRVAHDVGQGYWDITTPVMHYVLLYSTIVISLIGILGNTFVVFATIRYSPLRLDSVSIVFVRQIALTDILYLVIHEVSSIPVHITGRYLIPDTLCAVIGISRYIPAIANLHFIFTISTYRYFVCRTPLKTTVTVTTTRARLIALLVWSVSLTPSLVFCAKHIPTNIYCEIATCDIDTSTLLETEMDSALFYALVVIFAVIPFVGVIAANIAICVFAAGMAHKMKHSSKQACKTVSVISVILVLSWLPNIVIYALPVRIPMWCIQLSQKLYSVAAILNPFVYSFINKEFRGFVKKLLSQTLRRGRRQDNGNHGKYGNYGNCNHGNYGNGKHGNGNHGNGNHGNGNYGNGNGKYGNGNGTLAKSKSLSSVLLFKAKNVILRREVQNNNTYN